MGSTGSGRLSQQLGRYRLLKLLGEGGMGAVYLARDTQLDRDVALKVPQFCGDNAARQLERFRQEAKAAATIHHPNICPVFDVGTIDGVYYLTMAYIDGRPLAKLIRGERPPTPRQAAVLVRKVALAMSEAHKRSVVHRDLKPSNVMIDRRGEPIVMDFGLARRTQSGDERITQSGSVMGSPAYMSPEQVRGDVDSVGPSSDIYSLGVILYELLTQRLPFNGDSMALLSQVLLDEPPPPTKFRSELDPGLERICLKAMAKKPEDRYASMADLAADLQGHLRGTSPAVAATPQPAASPDAATTLTLPAGAPIATERQDAPLSKAVDAEKIGVRKKKRLATSNTPRRQSSARWLWAGGGAACAALAVAALALWLRHANNANPAAAKNTDGTVAAAGAATTKHSYLAASSAADANGAVDLLALIDPKRDAVESHWRLRDGKLVTPTGGYSRLQIPYAPPPEYRIDMELERQEDVGNGINLGFVAAGRQSMLVIDGFRSVGRAAGLETIDGKRAKENETTHRGELLRLNVPAKISLTVQHDRITFACDGVTILNWTGDQHRLGLLPEWEIPNRDHLFLGSQAVFVIRRLTLTPLSASGTSP